MSVPTMLLASADLSLVEAVTGVVTTIDALRMDVATSAAEACDRVGRPGVALVVAHQDEASDASNVTRLIQAVALTNPSAPVLVVADRHSAARALAYLRLGAADYLARPLDLVRLAYLADVLTLEARYGTRGATAPDPEPVQLLEDEGSFLYLKSTPMGRLMEQVRRVAPQDVTILLGGETGTGKTRLAGLIHRLSSRRGQPFLTINCGALSASLIESEMFGHVKGAFTGADGDRVGKFAAVGRGTLFLDEVDSLPPALQAKLLRAVEDRVFEPVGSNKTQAMPARLVVAGNRPLEAEVAAGRFRGDLYYRLNVVAFTIPPLRDRMEAVPHMARSFAEEFSLRAGQPIREIGPDAMAALGAYAWPGNIRELRNVIERAVALGPGRVIHLEDLPDTLQQLATAPAPAGPALLSHSKDEAERARIAEALERNRNNKLRAAAELGISRMTLYNKLRKYGLVFPT